MAENSDAEVWNNLNKVSRLKRAAANLLDRALGVKRLRPAWPLGPPTIDFDALEDASGGPQVVMETSESGHQATPAFVHILDVVLESDMKYRRARGEIDGVKRDYEEILRIKTAKEAKAARKEIRNNADRGNQLEIESYRRALLAVRDGLEESEEELNAAQKARKQAFLKMYELAKAEPDSTVSVDRSDIYLPLDLFSVIQVALDMNAALRDHSLVIQDLRRSLIDVGKQIKSGISDKMLQDLKSQRHTIVHQLKRARTEQIFHESIRTEREDGIITIVRSTLAQARKKERDTALLGPLGMARGDAYTDLDEVQLARERDRVPKLRDDLLGAISEAKGQVARCESRFQNLYYLYERDLMRFLALEPDARQERLNEFDRMFYLDCIRATQDWRKAEARLMHLEKIAKDAKVLQLADKDFVKNARIPGPDEHPSSFGCITEDGFVSTEGSDGNRERNRHRLLIQERVARYCNEVAASGPLADPFEGANAPVFAYDSVWNGGEPSRSGSAIEEVPTYRRLIQGWRLQSDKFREDSKKHGLEAARDDEPPARWTSLPISSRIVRAARILWCGHDTYID